MVSTYLAFTALTSLIYKSANACIVFLHCTFGFFNPYYSSGFFFFFCQFVLCCLFFVLNIYYLYVHIQLHRPNNFFLYIKARMRVLCFPLYIWFVQPLLFIRLLFFFPSLVCFVLFCFLSFLLNIYYLYAHIQLYRPNKILQYFHNYLTICTIHRPLFFFFFFCSPVCFVLFVFCLFF